MEKLNRIICVILLHKGEFYHSKQFKKFTYLGDPINTIRLLNQKNCLEIVILNIDDETDFDNLKKINSEGFMPISYGGCLYTMNEVDRIFNIGFEKVVIKYSKKNIPLINEVIRKYGNQSVCICIDYYNERPKSFFRKKNYIVFNDINNILNDLKQLSPGEIILQSITNDGMSSGYDIKNLQLLDAFPVPLIALGGCRDISDMLDIKHNTNIDGYAASTFFVMKNNGILINFPSEKEILF